MSPRMKQPISIARWGHFGVPVLVFPTAGGDAEEVERHRLVAHCQDLIDAGVVKLYSCDSVAGAAMLRKDGSPEYRMWLLNQFHQAVAYEVVPAIYADCDGPQPVLTAGASIGAFNALALMCRFPELFRAAICMSGTYNIESSMGGWSEDFYFSSPLHFLPGLEGPALDMLRQRFAILASGQGAWENVGESWAAAEALGQKGIPNRFDSWGAEWPHEWPTWWAMLPQYLRELVS
jgi:esterase/lipase superfamily enzyme